MPPTYHILLAKDHTLSRLLMVRILVRVYPSSRITAVDNGQKALDVFNRERVDLVVTNGRMQHMNGVDLIIALRARPSAVPILLLSSDGTILNAAKRAGASAVLNKPFTLPVLRRTLTQLLPATM